MKCSRCGKVFDDTIPSLNVERYGDPVLSVCPHCGKVYKFTREIIIKAEPLSDIMVCSKSDDWSHHIVLDKNYYKNKKI